MLENKHGSTISYQQNLKKVYEDFHKVCEVTCNILDKFAILVDLWKCVNFVNLEAITSANKCFITSFLRETLFCNALLQIYKRAMEVFETDGRHVPLYEGWNFNSGNYLFTIDTK